MIDGCLKIKYMINKEDFVTYEQALALKKLGFKEECLYHYDHQMVIPNESKIDSACCYIPLEEFYRSMNDKYSKQYGICDAPTLWEAQKWLRKEKKYSVEIESFLRHSSSWFCNIENFKDDKSIETYGLYKSYEEALSAGISECIKLLEKED